MRSELEQHVTRIEFATPLLLGYLVSIKSSFTHYLCPLQYLFYYRVLRCSRRRWHRGGCFLHLGEPLRQAPPEGRPLSGLTSAISRAGPMQEGPVSVSSKVKESCCVRDTTPLTKGVALVRVFPIYRPFESLC